MPGPSVARPGNGWWRWRPWTVSAAGIAVTDPQDGRAVGDHGDEVGLGGIAVERVAVVGNAADGDGDARRVGQAEFRVEFKRAPGRFLRQGHHLFRGGTA